MLGLLVATYVVVFGWLTWRQHARFGTFGFDMGIHDQGIWLLSELERPFVTVRGLHYLGHHLNLVSLLFVPAYWLGAGPGVLYLVETVFLGLGAVPVWLLARDLLSRPWPALVPAGAYLLHPTVSWINWWHFHPEALAVAPLLLSLWFARRRRWRWFAVSIAFVLSTKEDLALAVFVLGLVLAAEAVLTAGSRRQRRDPAAKTQRVWVPGAVTAVVGIGWYAVATQILMPWFNGGQEPFYIQELFPQFGHDAPSVIVGVLSDPARTWSLLIEAGRLSYYTRLLAPVGFLSLLGLPFLAIAGPQVAANALSGLATTYDARYHYSVVPTVAVFASLVHGLAVLQRWHRLALHVGLVVVVASTLASHRAWSLSPGGHFFRSGVWVGPSERHDAFDRAIAMVPDDASVAATYFLVPHLTHRERIYEWPNPWLVGNWGFANRNPHDPSEVDYLVLDVTIGQENELLSSLLAPDAGVSEFVTVFDEDGVLVAVRSRAR